jgi:arylsulfatase A
MESIKRREFLAAACKSAISFSLGAGLLGQCARTGSPGSKKPLNFVVILIDDLGWRDLGCYGSTFYQTPNIDRLAGQGARFTDFYAAAPNCSPTRASILTGKYPARLDLTNYLVGLKKKEGSPVLPAEFKHYLPLEEPTIAEALKPAGYTSAIVGKWHLGFPPYFPEPQGFDHQFGAMERGMPKSYFYPQWEDKPPIEAEDGAYLTDVINRDAEQWLEQNRHRPFCLFLSHYTVHTPLEAPEELIEKYRNNADPDAGQNNPIYASMIENMDSNAGRILAKLDELELTDNTVVIFTSDNGGLHVEMGKHTPSTSNAPLREGKGYLYEGGIRVPLIVRWPGVTTPGSTIHEPAVSTDFYPTILDGAGVENHSDGGMDGISLRKLITGKDKPEREALYFHFPHFSNTGSTPAGAVRRGDYKLIEFYEHGRLELYNLKEDIGENHNLAETKPELARELHQMLAGWRKDVGANMPVPNTEYPLKRNK